MKLITKIYYGLTSLLLVMLGGLFLQGTASAISISPMKQVVTLTPGEEYTSKIKIFLEASSAAEEAFYEASVVPLTVNDADNNYTGVYDKVGENNDIINWTTLSDRQNTVAYGDKLSGALERDGSKELYYTINVPEDTKGGGQYFAIMVNQVKDPNQKAQGNAAIKESVGLASVVYAEIPGDINISGEIKNNDIPGFYVNPPISTSFVATNNGNVHSEITYFMQVFPLFSNEEIYTTEENPGTDYVLPGTTRYVKQTWDNTPSVGIFKVRQTVYYDSTDSEPSVTEKMVIICPVWLLFVIIFAIAAIIIWIVLRIRSRGKSSRRSTESEA